VCLADKEISLDVVFTLCALLSVACIFLITWFRQRKKSEAGNPSTIDAGEWLLRGLLIVALVIFFGTVLLLLGFYSFPK
jgi:predicted Co/Zn/Cd cation transporter (cation efflux family)